MNTDPKLIASYAKRILELDGQIAVLNADKSDEYKAAKESEIDVAALRAAVAAVRKREKNPKSYEEQQGRVQEYIDYIDGVGTARATRARARGDKPDAHNPITGEITPPAPAQSAGAAGPGPSPAPLAPATDGASPAAAANEQDNGSINRTAADLSPAASGPARRLPTPVAPAPRQCSPEQDGGEAPDDGLTPPAFMVRARPEAARP